MNKPDYLVVIAGFRDSLLQHDHFAHCPRCGLSMGPAHVLFRRYLAETLQSVTMQCPCKALVEIYPGLGGPQPDKP